LADTEFEHLFTVPPTKFVDERNRIATALRKAGRPADAAWVKKMAKPTPSVFAANQAVRRDPGSARALLEATERLRNAQVGRISGDAFGEARSAQHRALDRLLEESRAALLAADMNVSQTVLEKTANNLRWGSLLADTRPLVEKGRLLRDVRPPGFEAFTGESLAPGRQLHLRSVPPEKTDTARDPAVATQKAAAAEKRLKREQRARIAGLRSGLTRAKTAALSAKRDHDRVDERRKRAEKRVEQLQREMDSTRDEVAEATREGRAAAQRVSAAEAEVERARLEIDAADIEN